MICKLLNLTPQGNFIHSDEQIYSLIIMGFCLFVVVVFLVYVLFKNPIFLDQDTFENSDSNSLQEQGFDYVEDHKYYISKEKETEILMSIEDFEDSLDFLEKDFCLNDLAKNIGVNQRYLSYVINKHKEMSFTSYINELKINYIVNCLKTDAKYLEYKISYLAEQCGFASHSRFTITFKKVTGEAPSDFIAKLKS